MPSITVQNDNANIRLDAFLANSGAYSSRSVAAKYCESGKVLVNGFSKVKKYKVAEGDTVEYEPEPDTFQINGQDIPLDIRYEDEHLLVISKQAGLVCHPANKSDKCTLVHALINHCGEDNLCDVSGQRWRLGIVHRLDADTSGLMICCKTNEAAQKIMADLKSHTINRHYKALLYGQFKIETGKIDAPVMRITNGRPRMAVRDDFSAKDAITTFTVLQNYPGDPAKLSGYRDGFSLIDCKLFTGRTHQIRTHMEYINHPVVGDRLYTSGAPRGFNAEKLLGLKRQFLHSYKLEFKHPITGENLQFTDDLAPDLDALLQQIR